MAKLYGEELSRREVLRRVGDIAQVAGIRESVLSSGKARGVRALDFRTGGGLSFTVLPGRAMDIAQAEFNGKALAYISQTGVVSPAYYEAPGKGFFRSFFAGLLTTCGMAHMGVPDVDEGEALGLHGRISNTDAQEVCVRGEWQGDDYVMRASGVTREASFFGENIALTRTIEARLGENTIWIHDEAENLGFKRQPLMVLYHFNFGYPLVSEHSRFVTSPGEVKARNPHSEKGLADCRRFQPPTPGYAEELFEYDLAPDAQGCYYAGIVNDAAGLGVKLRLNKSQLPKVGEWKQMGEGEYVAGIEPLLGPIDGRSVARANGTLSYLEPLEKRCFDIELSVLSGAEDIAAFDALAAGK